MFLPRLFLLVLLITGTQYVTAQYPATSGKERLENAIKRAEIRKNSVVGGIPFQSIGPSIMSGRVSDIDVNPDDPTQFYVAYASGGLWKTENNGRTFKPLFDHEIVITIGDIAVDWSRNIIWIGTGEVNSSRSSYAGTGIYKSIDGGKSWVHKGLPESHHVGRIRLDPKDPNKVWVAALGHLYSPNVERGVFLTEDGGNTWKHTLKVDQQTGAVDLIHDPSSTQILYAATWTKSREAWDFVESGTGSAIHTSIDGGKTWSKITTSQTGFPDGEGLGRIGLEVTRERGKTVLFAAIDNYFRQDPKPAANPEEISKSVMKAMTKEAFLALKKYQIKDYLQRNGFPAEYTTDKIIELVKKGEIAPSNLVEYTEDANAALFDAPVHGLEVYRSDDLGKSWKLTHEKGYLENVHFTYGYYFAQIRAANPNQLYVLGVPVLRSDNGGKTWKSINGDNVHSDHHALWVNPLKPGHLILGNDGGINISYDNGETWIKCNTPALGQFYHVAVDMAEPYRVYGGLQDNGVWMGPKTNKENTEWHDSGDYPFKSIMGGDGMQVAIDTRDNATVYTGFQFGNYFRINTKTGQRKSITPKHKLGDRPLRWNWETPIHLSVHNQDILYMASNKVHRSFNQGDSFKEISGDLTRGGKKGDVPYGTITCIHESPLMFGLLYVGTDDGLVHRSMDGGNTWERIDGSLPQNLWISSIQASSFKTSRVYVTLNGYRHDHFKPYLYVSEDYGKTWEPIGAGLPNEPVNCLKEDPVNEQLVYIGTDNGLYCSLDKGKNIQILEHNLPAVSVHDLVIHPRDKELVVGTHGRSIYLASVKELQQLSPEILAKPIHVFVPTAPFASPRWGRKMAPWQEAAAGEIPIPVYSAQNTKGTLRIFSESKEELFQQEITLSKGLQYVTYKGVAKESAIPALEVMANKGLKEEDKPVKIKPMDDGQVYLIKGKYQLSVEIKGASSETSLTLR
jgi:photosystem II stability/assembly factor-like uncharacterized protein